jgi:hypothetical protein
MVQARARGTARDQIGLSDVLCRVCFAPKFGGLFPLSEMFVKERPCVHASGILIEQV